VGLAWWLQSPDPADNGEGRTVLKRLLRRGTSLSRALFGPTEPVVGNRAKAARKGKPDTTSTLSTATAGTRIFGKVTNESDQPVNDVKVSLRPVGLPQGESFTTDKSGRFDAHPVDPGTYDILVAHPKYVTLIRPNFTIAPGQNKTIEMNFRLPLGIAIRGKVVDEDGKAVSGARVGARRRKMEQVTGGGAVFLDDATYKLWETDADGTFTLQGLSLGENVFECSRRGYEMATQNIDLRPEKAGEPIKIILRKTGRISGIVVDDRDNPMSTVTVTLVSYKPYGGPSEPVDKSKHSATTNLSGSFTFPKLHNEGFYDISVEHEAFAPGVFPLVAVGSERQVCRLQRGGTIQGHAEFIDRESTEASVLLAAQTVVKGTTFTKEVQSDGSGRFAFQNLPFGKYRLFVDSSTFTCEPKLDVPCQKDKPTKDVVIEVYEAAIGRGRVLNAETDSPIGGASISIQSSYGPFQVRSRSFTTRANERGEFEFRTLPAGLHVAQASAPEFVKTSSGASAQTFTLMPGETKNDISLRLDHGGVVDGFVLDPNGRPVEGAEIQLFLSGTVRRDINISKLKMKTDSSGFFKLWGIEIGEQIQMYASASKNGYAKSRSPVINLTAEKPFATTQIALARGGSISGRVTDSRNLPIPGAEVNFSSLEFPRDPSNSGAKVHTGSDGSYLIENCTAGKASVSVSQSGFVSAGRGLTVSDGRRSTDINFQLDNGLKISGKVLTYDGKPIPNARVRANPLKNVRGRDEAVTNKNGEYTLSNLGPGYFRVTANFTLKTPDGDQAYEFALPRVKSGTPDVELDCDVDNNASGMVENESRKGVDSFRVTLRSRSDTKPSQDFTFNFDRSYSTARGFFRVLNLPRGLYNLTVVAEGYEVYQTDDLVIGSSRRTVIPRIRLKDAGGVVGTLLSSSTNRPVNDVAISLIDPKKTPGEGKKTALHARSDYSGRFRVGSVAPGEYVIEFAHPNYVKSSLENIVVSQRKATDLGKLFLESGGTIQGTVTDDKDEGIHWVKVRISGVMPEKDGRTDTFGNYILQGVRPGRWPVVVEGNVNGRKIYAFRTVNIRADETEEANFRLETSADLDGMLAAADGIIRSGNIRIHPFDENASVIEDIRYDGTASAQRFQIHKVPPGQYFLWATGYGALTSYTFWQTLFLERGVNSVTLNLPAGAIQGQTVASAGGQATGVGLQLRPLIDGLRVPQSIYNALVLNTFSGQQGEFTFNYLQPGGYQLLFLDPSSAMGGQWVAMPPVWLNENQRVGGYNVNVGK
jgi:protocatechuate 3,4-dioxygenase beta subunit